MGGTAQCLGGGGDELFAFASASPPYAVKYHLITTIEAASLKEVPRTDTPRAGWLFFFSIQGLKCCCYGDACQPGSAPQRQAE